MSSANVVAEDLPEEVKAWVDQPRYEEDGEFPVERGYFWTSCSSVENANPLYWDDQVAEELTGGPIAPPTLLSAWFRPHHWAPGRTSEVLPLQVHFDLKEALGLPEAAMSDNTIIFDVPVRPGDRLKTRQYLRPVSELKKTKLGIGRFWVIEVEYTNQRGERVGLVDPPRFLHLTQQILAERITQRGRAFVPGICGVEILVDPGARLIALAECGLGAGVIVQRHRAQFGDRVL